MQTLLDITNLLIVESETNIDPNILFHYIQKHSSKDEMNLV